MPQAAHHNSPRLRTMYSGRELLQIVSMHDAIRLDATAFRYDTRGWLASEHATLDLAIEAAQELAGALNAAITEAEAIDHPDQLRLWSEETIAPSAPRRRSTGR